MKKILRLKFFAGDRGLGYDSFYDAESQDQQPQYLRIEVDAFGNSVRWIRSPRGQDPTPLKAGIEIRVLALKQDPEDGEEKRVFTEHTYNVFGDAGLSNKEHPFSWEPAAEGYTP